MSVFAVMGLFNKVALTHREEETGDPEKVTQARYALELSAHGTPDMCAPTVPFYEPHLMTRSILA